VSLNDFKGLSGLEDRFGVELAATCDVGWIARRDADYRGTVANLGRTNMEARAESMSGAERWRLLRAATVEISRAPG
jgi:hypothetical protein